TYPTASSATRLSALFFDTCTAPSLTALAAWRGTSPYTGVNIYFGGRNRGCAQPNLTPTWVQGAAAAGWSLVPTYFGDQPFCVFGSKPYRYAASGAAARGTADGNDAVAAARALGLRAGSALYADVEHYDRASAGCTPAVRTYVSEWTRALHRAGFLA
ncbi:glycoside hydrolase domain-containing protein, partial [Pseudomonas sp. 100_A]|uniref:glycoside hydrolase domain-containing protein n=1 Tax=Pseudomonas sp. 100_A TaxID=2813571 RepID=UPI001A9EEC26